MNDLIKPRILSMMKSIQGSQDDVLIKTSSFHVEDKLNIRINKHVYHSAIKQIKQSYEQYV